MSLLSLRGVQSGYGEMQVLWNVDLDADEGETVLLLGANSAGKTTLLRAIIGLLPCWAGEIEFNGERIERLSPDKRIQRGLAFMSELGVFPTLSIEENIRLGGYFLSDAEVRKRSARLFDLFPDLAKKRKDSAGTLSGGQRKMLGVAKVLVSEPKLLLMDEPSSGLAPIFVKQVIEVLKTMIGGGTSLLIAEQNVAFLELATRGFLIDHGSVKLSGTREELQSNDAVREAYFGLSKKTDPPAASPSAPAA